MKCPSCSERTGKDWKYCPYCGYTLPREPRFKDLMNNNVMRELRRIFRGLGMTAKHEQSKEHFIIRIKTNTGPDIKFESGKGITHESSSKFLKMPEDLIEPEVEVKQFLNEMTIKAELPGVKKLDNVLLKRVGESIEIRAVAKKKGYFRVLHVPKEFMLESKKLNKGLLELKLRV